MEIGKGKGREREVGGLLELARGALGAESGSSSSSVVVQTGVEGSAATGETASTTTTAAPQKTAHDLSLLLILLCFGSLTDMTLSSSPLLNPTAERYYQLTKAALGLEPVLERPPSVATVQTLALMAIYEGMCGGENSIESTWGVMGLATKLAQSVSLWFLFLRGGGADADFVGF